MYLHPVVNDLLSKIKPTELQEDLKQELMLVLLDYNCKKIAKLNKEDNLLRFTLRILWKMGTGTNGDFYKKYRKNNLIDIFEYYNVNENIPIDDMYNIAFNQLKHKMTTNPNDAHESIIFTKYVELKSCTKVAKYFNIPKKHVFLVVKKTKDELKKTIKDNL
jgi:hypothetical protein